MIKAIHQSMLSTFLRCAEQGRRIYIEGQRIPPGIAACRGTGVHHANKINLRQKIISGQDLPLDSIQDAARDGYVHALSNGVFLPKEQVSAKKKLLNEGLNDAIRCSTVYLEKVAPEIIPVAVEEHFEIDIGLELPLGGIMDIEREGRIDDLKTAGKSWPEGRIEKEIQPIFYSFVKEKISGVRPEFIYHILIARRNKEGVFTSTDYQNQRLTASDAQYRILLAKIRVVLDMIQKGSFPPCDSSSNFLCTPMWCGFYRDCVYI